MGGPVIALNLSARGMTITDAMRTAVEKHLEHLETLYDRVEKCDVVISAPHRHHSKGKIYHVDIKLEVPRSNIVVNRETELNPAHEDFYKTLTDAFGKAERQLREHVRSMRGFVKTHEKPSGDADETRES